MEVRLIMENWEKSESPKQDRRLISKTKYAHKRKYNEI